MAGRRLLDAAILFNASRRVAHQHFRIRREQLEAWSQTSSLAKSVKNQTDRVTLTASAAAALVRRLNEEIPQQASVYTKAADPQAVPRNESVTPAKTDTTAREGIHQDHHYQPSESNAAQDTPSSSEFVIEQKESAVKPTPDGTIPPVDSPTAEPITGVNGKQNIPEHNSIPEQDEVPEGINTDVFHSPRVKKMLGGRKRANELHPRHVVGTPDDQTPQSHGQDQASFNVRKSGSRVAQPDPAAEENSKVKVTSTKSEDIEDLAANIAKEADLAESRAKVSQPLQGADVPFQMRESRVPSSRLGRLWEYSGLATSMAFGAVGETFRRAVGRGEEGSLVLSAGNMERLVAKLSRMRGAALKLGQMMSFQDSKMLPAPIHEVLMRVQDNADYMPAWQRNKVLASNLGDDWQTLFSSFDDVPMAAASIGQVHRATLASSNTPVAVKIQYPGVATSISSDLNNLSVLLTASRLLPKGLYLDKTIANARTELAWECDYVREADAQQRFRELLSNEQDVFVVPRVFREASGPQVLTAELMHGIGVTKVALKLDQAQRNWIGTNILRLCLRELTEFKFMQTDPNWTNFLYNPKSKKLELLDFGAAREFPSKFVDPYVHILIAASKNDRQTIRDLSVQLGYLTGAESKAMEDAHINSVLTLSEPFKDTETSDHAYDFRDQTITDRVRGFIPIMLRERLAPPPEETYSLHRKLSGAFLLLARLGSQVKCRDLFVKSIDAWQGKLPAAQS